MTGRAVSFLVLWVTVIFILEHFRLKIERVTDSLLRLTLLGRDSTNHTSERSVVVEPRTLRG